jgi:K+-transporting ATPase KdpF subunit
MRTDRRAARGATLTLGDVVLLALVVAVLVYLLWALLAPERFG